MNARTPDGQRRHAAGSPASIGGRFAPDAAPDAATSLGAPESVDDRSMIARSFDDEYRLAGFAPAPGKVIHALEARAYFGELGNIDRHDEDGVSAYLDHLERIGKLDAVTAAAGDTSQPYDAARWMATLTAVEAMCREAESTPSPAGALIASDGYLGATKVTGSMYEGAHKMGLSDTEVNKLIRTDIKHATDSGYLPKAAKISVRKSRGSSYIQVSVSGIPRGLMRHPGDAYDSNDPRPSGPTDYGRELAARIEVVTGAYGRNDTNSQVDYFNSYRSPSVSFHFDEPEPGAHVR